MARFEGEAKKVLANAELESNKYLGKSREFELRGKRLDVYQSLAMNKSLVISGSGDKDFNMLLLADNVLSTQGKSSVGGQASLMSELNMMRLASHAYGLSNGTYIPDEGLPIKAAKI